MRRIAPCLLVVASLLVSESAVSAEHASRADALSVQTPPTQQPERQRRIPTVPSQKLTATVPDLAGQTLNQAMASLERSRLRLGGVTNVSSDAPPGTVVEQNPPAHTTVEIGAAIDVTIAAERRPVVRVPDLLGRHETELTDILGRLDLALGQVRRRADVETRGTVIEQTPRPGAFSKPGGIVDVVVADPQLTRVPDLAQQRLEDAQRLCVEAGLQLQVTERRPSTAPEGSIVAQAPDPGALVPLRSTVTVAVAEAAGGERGATANVVIVPDLSGLLPADARRVVMSIGLDIGLAPEDAGAGLGGRRIASQSPPPGSAAARGAVIMIRFGPQPRAPFPWAPVTIVGAAAAALAGLEIVRRRWRSRRLRPQRLRVTASNRRLVSEVEHEGDLVDVEMRLQARLDPEPATEAGADAEIITEARSGER